MTTATKTKLNKPRCPVCGSPLNLWAYAGDGVAANCDECGWEWRE